MTREIKFRLRDEKDNIVGYEKWYQSDDKWLKGERHPSTGLYEPTSCWLYSIDNENWYHQFIPHRYKDQYTGLKVKEGKEIYKGDILSYGKYIGHLASMNKDCLHEVRWDDKRASFITIEIFTQDEFPSIDVYQAEIIGNIYEKPRTFKGE